MQQPIKKIEVQDYVVMILLALIWGSSFILMNKGLYASDKSPLYTPLQMAALRMTIAATVMSPLLFASIKAVPKRLWPWIAIVGLIGSGIPAALFATAQKQIDSSLAGILNSLTPLFTMLISVIVLKKHVASRQKWGILIGLIGAILLISVRGFSKESSALHALLIVVATLFYGISVNTIAQKLNGVKSYHISSLSLAMVAIPYGIYLFGYSDFMDVYHTPPEGPRVLGFIALLAIASTAIANFLFFRLTQRTGAIFSSSVTYLMPIVAVAWGLYFQESLTWSHALCGLVILVGVYLVSRPKPSISGKSIDVK
jgi:drug/metabolite transporter (DMT)-like permease